MALSEIHGVSSTSPDVSQFVFGTEPEIEHSTGNFMNLPTLELHSSNQIRDKKDRPLK